MLSRDSQVAIFLANWDFLYNMVILTFANFRIYSTCQQNLSIIITLSNVSFCSKTRLNFKCPQTELNILAQVLMKYYCTVFLFYYTATCS